MELELWNWRKWRNLWNNGMELWENGINHKDRSDESNGFTERFDGAVWTRRFSRKDTMHSNGTKQIGGITGENCYKCQDWQSWKMFDSCVNFSWFFWEVWLGELATLGMIVINDIKDGFKIKRNWWNCLNWWNKNNQINGINGVNKTVGISSTNEHLNKFEHVWTYLNTF